MEHEDHDTVQELPQYKCHKEVGALMIANVEPDFESGKTILTPAEAGYGAFRVKDEYVSKHAPAGLAQNLIGGYYVVYADGYESWSPAEAFESGYALFGSA